VDEKDMDGAWKKWDRVAMRAYTEKKELNGKWVKNLGSSNTVGYNIGLECV
jgi:hypothetical protein